MLAFDKNRDILFVTDLMREIRKQESQRIQEIANFVEMELVSLVTKVRESNEVETIIRLIEYLSINKKVDLPPGEETEPDPDRKIYKRFSDHADFLTNSYKKLASVYTHAVNEAKKVLGLDAARVLIIGEFLKETSDQFLTKSGGNPKTALEELTDYFAAKISTAGFKNYEAEEKRLKRLNLEKDHLIIDLDNMIEKQEEALESFKNQILEIHESIMGNKECSFDIETIDKPNRKEVVNFDMRIYDDGSHSVERAKVFIYDMALLFNDFTRERHPKLLIHDNIFDVDQDTLVRSLNYLGKQEEKYDDFQYILTLNRDKVENEEKREMIELDIKGHTIASFTKKKKFLKKDYQEL